MARVNVTIHGEEDVSTASQKVRSSLHDLKEKAKESISPLKDLSDTVKMVAGLGGAALVLKQIWGEMREMEQAYLKLNPAAANATGSLTQWTDAMTRLKADAGGVVAGVLNPIRAALLDIIDPAWQVKLALEGINNNLADLTGKYISAETKKIQDLAQAQKDLADAMKQASKAAAERGEYSRMLQGLQSAGRPDTGGEAVAAYMQQYGVTADYAMTKLNLAAEDWDRQVSNIQGFITSLDATIEQTAFLIQEIPKRIEQLTKPAGKPASTTPTAPGGAETTFGSSADYLAPAMTRGRLSPEDRIREVIEIAAPIVADMLGQEQRDDYLIEKAIHMALINSAAKPETSDDPTFWDRARQGPGRYLVWWDDREDVRVKTRIPSGRLPIRSPRSSRHSPRSRRYSTRYLSS